MSKPRIILKGGERVEFRPEEVTVEYFEIPGLIFYVDENLQFSLCFEVEPDHVVVNG